MQSATLDTTSVPQRRGLLVEPTYGWGDTAPRRPSFVEIWIEWFDAINFFKHRTRLLTALFTAFHVATFGIFIYFFARHFSILHVALVLGISSVIATVFNTVWYHRYCTHKAYTFSSLFWPRVFLWINPVCFREESYVIPHHIHHSKGDKPGDPYGPHLGWLGSYLASESSANINTDINRSDYERLAKSLRHIGFPQNTYEQFQRTGSVENAWHWVARSIFANLLWCLLAYLLGGRFGVLTWLSGIFLYTFFVRDFNYRGHGGFFFKASEGHAANQIFYGLIAGEWHENHHTHPRLAHSGLAWWQVDLAYWMIRAMGWCGIVNHINTLDNSAPRRQQSAAAQA